MAFTVSNPWARNQKTIVWSKSFDFKLFITVWQGSTREWWWSRRYIAHQFLDLHVWFYRRQPNPQKLVSPGPCKIIHAPPRFYLKLPKVLEANPPFYIYTYFFLVHVIWQNIYPWWLCPEAMSPWVSRTIPRRRKTWQETLRWRCQLSFTRPHLTFQLRYFLRKFLFYLMDPVNRFKSPRWSYALKKYIIRFNGRICWYLDSCLARRTRQRHSSRSLQLRHRVRR